MADARLQVTIDAVDNASAHLRSVEHSLSRFGMEARRVGLAMGLIGGAVAGAMTLAIKSTADGQKALSDLGDTVNELQRNVGAVLVPVIEKLNEVLKPVVAQLIEFVKEHPKIVQAVFLIAGALVILGAALFLTGTLTRAGVAAFDLLHGVIGKLGPLLTLLTAAFTRLGIAGAAAWSSILGPALAVIGTFLLANDLAIRLFKFLHLIPQDTKPLWQELGQAIGSITGNLLKGLLAGADALVGGVNKITGLDIPNFTEMFQGLKGVFDGLTGALGFLANAWNTMGDAASAASSKVAAARATVFTNEAETRLRLLSLSVSSGTVFEDLAEGIAQQGNGQLFQKLQAFRGGERNPELLQAMQLLIRLVSIQLGQDPTLRAGQGQNWMNLQIDGRTILQILGNGAAVAEQVRSS